MSKQLQDAYIVAASRTPIGKAPRGVFKNTRPDELLVHALKSAVAQVPGFDTKLIEDAIIGCAIPEAEQGLNVARALAGLPQTVGGVTVNRFCASGITALAMAADRIRVGESGRDLRGRLRIDEHGADDGQQAVDVAAHLRSQRRLRHRVRDGPDGRRVAEQWKVSREDWTHSRSSRTARRLPPSRPASSTTRSPRTRSPSVSRTSRPVKST